MRTEIISYTLPAEIDVSSGDTWATIVASSPLDIETVLFRFDERILYGGSSYGTDFVGVWGYGDDWDDGRSGRILEISGDNAVGTVTLDQVEITETNGTETILTQAELSARGLQTSFEFVNDPTITPTLPTSDFDPANLAYTFDPIVNIGGTGGDFSISASADHTSDIEEVVFWLDSEIERGSGSSYSFFGLYGISDSWSDGNSSRTFALTQFNDSGTVDIQKVEVSTSSGIDYIYYEHDLAALGLETNFSLINQNDSYTATDITEPNDSFATAHDVNSKTSASLDSALASLSGLSITSTLDVDLYLIEVAQGEAFSIDLTFGTGAGDLDLEFYDEQRFYIDGSYYGVSKETLTISEPGTYYLAAYGYDGAEGNYSLSATRFSGIAEDIYEDNDTLATAYDFGVQNSSVSGYFTDLTIDKAYDDDYFAFAIDTAADLDIAITFDHDKGDLDLALLDSAGNWLAGSSTTANEESISVKGLAAGDYYFTVYGYEGATSPNYSVTSTLTLDPLPDNADVYERNDSFEEAFELGEVSISSTESGPTAVNFVMASTSEALFGFEAFVSKEVENKYNYKIDLWVNSDFLPENLNQIDGFELDISAITETNTLPSLIPTYDFEYAEFTNTNRDQTLTLSGISSYTTASNFSEDIFDSGVWHIVGSDAITLAESDDDYIVSISGIDYQLGNIISNNFKLGSISFDINSEIIDAKLLITGELSNFEHNETVTIDSLSIDLGYLKEGLQQENDRVFDANLHDHSDTDFYNFYLNGAQTLGVEAVFSHTDGDLDIELFDSDGHLIDGAATGSDNEYLSLTGLAAGSYTLKAYGYDGATVDDYSIRFVEETFENWWDTYDNWWDWQEAEQASSISADIYEENDSFSNAASLGVISTSTNFNDLTIDTSGDADWFKFTYEASTRIDVGISFDGNAADLDMDLYDANGNWIDGSYGVEGNEELSLVGLDSGDYYFSIYEYEYGTVSDYDLSFEVASSSAASDLNDAYEPNNTFATATDLGSAFGEGSMSNLTLTAGSSGGTTSLSSPYLAVDDVLLISADRITASQASNESRNFSNSFSGASSEDIIKLTVQLDASHPNWNETAGIIGGMFQLKPVSLGQVQLISHELPQIDHVKAGYTTINENVDSEFFGSAAFAANLPIVYEGAWPGASDYYQAVEVPTVQDILYLYFDPSDDLDNIQFELGNINLTSETSVTGAFESNNSISDAVLILNHIMGVNSLTGSERREADHDSSGDLTIVDLVYYLRDMIGFYPDSLEPVNHSGLNSATTFTVNLETEPTEADVDWYKAYFANDGTPDQYVSAIFDHQDGDIDIELYDSDGNLLRSSESVDDNETIYLSDIAGGSYYYLKVYQYGESNFQEYSIDYSFPVAVSAETISPDSLEASNGNEAFTFASNVDIIDEETDLTIHSATDVDWFSFTTRNLSSSSSEISISYDEALGSMNLSLWAMDVGQSTPTIVTASASGTGREVISFHNYAAGTYYLQAFGSDGALIPDYSLSMNVYEVEGGGSQSNVIAADQFDRASSNDTSETATALGTLSTTLNVADLSIHSESDKDFLSFGTTYAGETQVTLYFSHEAGDIDSSLKDSSGTEVAYGMSADDNETLTFQSSVDESYTLEVYGYGGETNRDYDLTIIPKQLNSRRDEYESNDDASSAITVRDTRASFDNLTLHNASDQDWFKFTIADTAGSSNAVQVTNLLGANAELKIYGADGSTQVGSTVSITGGSGSVDTSGFAAGDYYAVVSSTASSTDSASEQLSNFKLYVDQTSGATPTQNASWTVMVYVAGDNDLASAAVDDLNEMEGVVLPENVNVVTLTDLSDDYATNAGWADTRQGAISPDPNGYSWYGEGLVSDLESLGELNTGDPTTLTNFINWSTENHSADNYALVLWDHGGGLAGIAWDDTDGHDNLTIAEIKSGIENSATFSSGKSLDLIGFDACVMQTYEVGLEMSSLANVMVASQESEPNDGWDYQAFLQSLADNPYASAQTLGGYIVDGYDAWYDSNGPYYDATSWPLSSVDLTKFQSVDTAISAFNSVAQNASSSDWHVIDDAAENAWTSDTWNYGWMGEERDLGQFFEYISDNASDNALKTAAAAVATAVNAAVIDNSSRQGLSGIQAGLLEQDAYLWSGAGLIGKSGSAWGQFQQLYDVTDRAVRSANAENLTPDYSETRDALGRSSQGNNTSLTAFDLGTVTNATLVDNLTIHNAQDIDWYSFATPTGLGTTGNTLKVNATNIAPLKVALYDSDRELIAQREGVDNSFDLTASSNYFIKVETSTGRQDIGYQLDVDLVAAEPTEGIVVADLAEGSSSNDVAAKATSLAFAPGSNLLSNLGLSLTDGDRDWFEISAGRLSAQSPNLFSVIIDETNLTDKEDVVIELANASGVVLTSSTSIGSRETVVFEDYSSDILINVKSSTGQILDYKLDLRHADYDVDGNGSVSSATDGAAILSSLTTDSSASEVAANLLEGDATSTLSEYMTDLSGSLLDVDGDGVTSAATDGVILQAYLAGASASDLLPLISATSPIETADELLTHLLDIA